MQELGARAEVIKEASVNSPLAHLRFLHSTGRGWITVGQRDGPCGPWYQHSNSYQKLADVISAYSGEADVYITQNRFYGSHKVKNLAELCTLFSDLDYYKIPALVEMPTLGVLHLALETLERAGIPRPSLVIDTGRGLALIWRHEPVPRKARSRWMACQNRIYEVLTDLGADRAARDASRMLRLVGTYNSKSGTQVQLVWADPEEEKWAFDDLANEILPLTRTQVAELRAKRQAQRGRKQVENGSKRQTSRRKGWNVRSLNRERLRDLQRLMALRHMDRLPPGQRDSWMFVAGVCLSYLVKPEVLETELIKLGREKAGWSEAETRSRMHTVIQKAWSAFEGNKEEWGGQQRDPRYRLTNCDIIQRLGITPDEEQEMKVIISNETKRPRNTAQQKQRRRSRGVRPREEYVADTRERRQHDRRRARELRDRKMRLREIGRELRISHTQVRRLLDSP